MTKSKHLHNRIEPACDTKHVTNLLLPLRLSVDREITFELQQDDAAGATTGTTLWLGAQILTAYILSLNLPKDRRAIELGSGIGFSALALAASGLDILATDLPILTDGLLGSNAQKNVYALSCLTSAGKLAITSLDWTADGSSWIWPDLDHQPPFDLILTADSIYSEELVEPLLSTTRTLSILSSTSDRGPDVYLAYEHRDDAQYDNFLAKAAKAGFRIKRIPAPKVRKAVEKMYGWEPRQYEGISVVHLRLYTSASETLATQ